MFENTARVQDEKSVGKPTRSKTKFSASLGIHQPREEISLYFHIPFCTKKCPYCSFYVVPDKSENHAPFTRALIKECALRLPQVQGHPICSLYFGGGTPTKLAPAYYAEILGEIARSLTCTTDCEITLEANPEDLTPELCKEYKSLGFNRISIGVQSLVDGELALLERTHSADRAQRATFMAHAAGFDNISIDLLFELPKQTTQSFRSTLDVLATLPIAHLSLYNLTFEPHTAFTKRKEQLAPLLPSDEEGLQLWQQGIAAIEALGLKRYEISAFARLGRASRHNTGYWTGRPFLGLGPSAFSYWDGRRFSNSAHLAHYIRELEAHRLPVDFEECLDAERRQRELFLVGLRLMEGVQLDAFEARHGRLSAAFTHALEAQRQAGMLHYCSMSRRWALSEEGLLHFDGVGGGLVLLV